MKFSQRWHNLFLAWFNFKGAQSNPLSQSKFIFVSTKLKIFMFKPIFRQRICPSCWP